MVSCDTSEGLTLTLYTAISLQTCLFLEEFVLAALPAVVVVVSDAGVSVLLVFMLVVL